MNRRIFIQIAAPSLGVGLLLIASCLASVWYINRLQRDLAKVLAGKVTSLQAAQELEIRVRQLRFHCFAYLIDPRKDRLRPIEQDNVGFADALATARPLASTDRERGCIALIERSFADYQREMTRLRTRAQRPSSQAGIGELIDQHPVRQVVDGCQELLRLNREAIERTSADVTELADQARLAMVLVAIVGPVSGVLVGYGIARGVSRSIYRLSLRVQNMAEHLEQDVASVELAADGDINHLDKQLEHVVARVEEVGTRLQQHQNEMLRAEQLAAVGQLAASVAHEVRNPLTSIKLLVESALRRGNQKALTLEDLQVIHGAITRLERTVGEFLEFARPAAPQRVCADLRQSVEQAVELVRARARQQHVDLQIRCPREPVVAKVDQGQLSNVLVNLFLNALDAMPNGGRLEVNLAMEAGEAVRIGVEDTGPGIDPTIASRLFTPFTSTKATGTGLGLSICRRIIEEHQGSITATTRPEGGARFTIRLPAATAERVPCPRCS